MKVIAFNGSPHKRGNTYHALKIITEELEKEHITTEIISVGNKVIRGCMGCALCARNKNEKCVYETDEVNDWIQKMKTADGFILGSPVYFSGINGTMKSFLDRAFFVSGVNDYLFRHKVGAAISAVRRSGGVPTVDQLNHYLCYSEMILPTSNYWNVAHGLKPGEIKEDGEGEQIMRILGKNMAWLLKLKQTANELVQVPIKEEKVMTNFIR